MPLWIAHPINLLQHPKTRRLAALLGTSRAAAVGHLTGIWCGAVQFARDGDLTEVEPDEIARWADWDGDPAVLLDALEQCRVRRDGDGYLERHGARLCIHEWDEHEGRTLAKLDASKERAEKSRQARREREGVTVQPRQRPRAEAQPHKRRYQERKAADAPDAPDAPTHERRMGMVVPLFPDAITPAPGPTAPAPAPAAAANGAGKVNKSAALIDYLRGRGLDVTMTAADHKALKETTLAPAQVGAVYEAIFCGNFGDDWLREHLTVRRAIDSWNGYQASQQPRQRPHATTTRPATGAAAALNVIARRHAGQPLVQGGMDGTNRGISPSYRALSG